MTVETILGYAHRLLKEAIQKGDDVVDATVGNGHDTLKLAEWVGESGRVFGFDIQQQAIDATQLRLEESQGLSERVTLYHKSHADIDEVLESTNIKAAVFNLGYLPGGDKSIVTVPQVTIQAIEQLQNHLLPGGVLVLVVYPGHPEGRIEAEAVLQFASNLDQRNWHVGRYERINQKSAPPFVIIIEKARSN